MSGLTTAAAIAAIAYDEPAAVVDGNVERVLSRYYAILEPLPASKPEIRAAAASLTPQDRAGDYAQSMMDLGATICTPKSPACLMCPISEGCEARVQGLEQDLPRKLKKAPKPVRLGHVFVARNAQGGVLLERRPEKGLLGGMLGFPGSDWGDEPVFAPPFAAQWEEHGEVRHTFTHFHLVLKVHCAVAEGDGFVAARNFDPDDLPSLMKKVWNAARGAGRCVASQRSCAPRHSGCP